MGLYEAGSEGGEKRERKIPSDCSKEDQEVSGAIQQTDQNLHKAYMNRALFESTSWYKELNSKDKPCFQKANCSNPRHFL